MRGAFRAAVCLLAALVLGSPACAQDRELPVVLVRVDTVYRDTLRDTVQLYSPIPNNALATTGCLGGRPVPVIDIRVLETPIATEIIEHEKVHIEQIARVAPDCPDYSTPEKLLVDEVEAYCRVRKYREAQGWSRDSVNQDYLKRLKNQFDSEIHADSIAATYREHCK